MTARRRDKAGFRRFFGYLEETGLDEPIREIVRAHATTLLEIYGDERGPSAHAARLETWWTLSTTYRKSNVEIARLFDRDPTSIVYGLRTLADAEEEENLVAETVRVLARRVAARSRESSLAGVSRARAARELGRLSSLPRSSEHKAIEEL